MSIRSWPESERPRERLLSQGASALSDAELLAIFLRTGTARGSAIELARHLLDRFDGLSGLLAAPPQLVMACHGMGPAKYTHLMAALELGSRHIAHRLQGGDALSNPTLVNDYLSRQLKSEAREVVALLMMDSQLKMIAFEKVFFGTTTACSVHIGELIRRLLAHYAVQAILVHNHPDAPAHPSHADHVLTANVVQACKLLDIHLLDHIIVGRDGVYSFLDHGVMPP